MVIKKLIVAVPGQMYCKLSGSGNRPVTVTTAGLPFKIESNHMCMFMSSWIGSPLGSLVVVDLVGKPTWYMR